MINLIPHTQKKELERAYFIRVVTLFILVAGIIVLCGLILLLPIYIATVSKKQIVETQVAALNSQKNTSKEELNSIISDINAKLSVFADSNHKFSFSNDVILPVLEKQNPGIRINTISFSLDKATSSGSANSPAKNIIISGTAKDRPSLLKFENNLKQNTTFSGVNVPISNFVSGSDISFNIQFKLELQ